MAKTALVLSGGGMFGAYQVGVWQALEGSFHPDLVVGASIGSLNGWAIAGGAGGEELEHIWREAGPKILPPVRWPLEFPKGLKTWTQSLYARYKPKVECGIVVTQLQPLRPRVFRGGEVTWQHLTASCAIPLLIPSPSLGGARYADGGLLAALPLWAASEMGATRIVAVNVWPGMPWPISNLVGGLRKISGLRSNLDGVEVLRLDPTRSLGPRRGSITWNRERFDRWVSLGREDGAAFRL